MTDTHTNTHIDGLGDSMTDPAQRAEFGENCMEGDIFSNFGLDIVGNRLNQPRGLFSENRYFFYYYRQYFL